MTISSKSATAGRRDIPRLAPTSRVPSVWRQAAAPLIAGVIVLAACASALAQGAATPGENTAAAAREGNIYDHKDHQPTEAELRAAEKAAGITSPPGPTRRQVLEDVDKLLNQTDTLDKQSVQRQRDDGGGSSTVPAHGR